MAKTIAIGCDHAGYIYKDKLCDYLKAKGFNVLNMGTDSAQSVDYPLYAKKVCNCINEKQADFGILICGTGVGMSIAANKHKGIRAALCTDLVMAEFTRRHNDSNVLCMGARIIAYEMAEMIAEKFLNTEFEGGRHQRRIDMLEN
ncbi:ribose 5-phosphate isomerase B [Treponema pectinovorum]|uniref:ribose 5-phosphate isomerase B n=1 Tax=Treponema pectinovorum TaxID=164 RepID=UPI0011CC220E|nr:ribose 5-phosphate isomerase B [Treponema pectinovorum]